MDYLQMFFTLALLQTSHTQDTASQFIGCYRDDDSSNLAMTISSTEETSTNSIRGCLDFCKSLEYTFSGLKASKECHCGEDFSKHGTSGSCDKSCDDSSGDICGGDEAISVYTSCPIGTYGTNCQKSCPHSCNNMNRKMCHLITGKCCGGSGSVPYCIFFDLTDCGRLSGDPRAEVSNMSKASGSWMNFFKTLSFPYDGEVTEIQYFTRRADDIELLSIWRNRQGDNYMMVAKIELKPTKVGKQTLPLSVHQRLFVRSGDAIALHFPSLESEADMIPYAYGSNLPSGIEEADLHEVASVKATGSSWSPGHVYSFSLEYKRTAAIALKYNCIKDCPKRKYGGDCANTCHYCKNNDNCHFMDGTCPNGCAAGYQTYKCDQECTNGLYGDKCENECGNCIDLGSCYHVNGHCLKGCKNGYQGVTCSEPCDHGMFGVNCSQSCGECKDSDTCNHIDGYCDRGCKNGYKGYTCHERCDDGSYGFNCLEKCGSCIDNITCDFEDGHCNGGCEPGFLEPYCNISCKNRTFGPNCTQLCGKCKDKKPCDHRNGICPQGCEAGYKGHACNTTCDPGFHGENCEERCGNCLSSTTCNLIDGSCAEGCQTGYEEPLCKDAVKQEETSNPDGNTGALVGGIVAALLAVVIVILLVVFVIRKRSNSKKEHSIDRSAGKQFSNVYEIDPDESSVDHPSAIKLQTSEHQKPPSSRSTGVVKPEVAKKPSKTDIYINTSFENERKSLSRVQIGSLGQYIRTQMTKAEPFSEEFQLLPKDQHGCWDYSGQESLRSKNRYKNIMPYDDYRVVLPVINEDPLTDYINASFIKGYRSEKRYIASHGPSTATMDDFWRMIWEYEVEVIVMLTNFVEQMRIKCDQYWPSSGLKEHGGVTIETEKQEDHGEYIVRHFQVKKGNEQRKIRHYHFTNWPDKGVPHQSSGILALRKVVQSYRKKNTLPLVVHCSAGIGRTGTFIATDWCLDQIEQEGEVDIFECVKTLRVQRINMVQALIQYKFLYFTILEAATVGITQIKLSNFQQKLSEILSRDKRGQSQMSKEFKYLEVVKPNMDVDQTHVGRSPENKDKNRDMDVIPDEASRIILPSSSSTYVNAVHVKGYNDTPAFIATQVPLLGTNEDFWKLVVDFKCRGIVVLEEVNDNKRWFPEQADHIQVGEFVINNNAMSKIPDTIVYDLLVEKRDQSETEYANVDTLGKVDPRLFICTSWSPDEAGAATLKTLCSEVYRWINMSDHKNVVVLCRNGAARTGLFIAYCNLFNMVSDMQEVNVMEVVKNIRKTRPQFVSTTDEYSFLYEAVAVYLEGDQTEQTYANL